MKILSNEHFYQKNISKKINQARNHIAVLSKAIDQLSEMRESIEEFIDYGGIMPDYYFYLELCKRN